MNPGEVCTAELSSGGAGAGGGSGGGDGSFIVDALAQSGSSGSLLIISITLCALLIGALALFGAHKLRRKQQLRNQLQGSATTTHRSAAHGAPLSLLSLVCAGVILASLLQPSASASAQVQYSDGCRLIEVSEATHNAAAQSLLPGDEITIMTAVITNVSSVPLDVSVDSAYTLGSPLEHATQLSTLLNGSATTSLRLSPGAHATAVVRLKFSDQAGNSAQHASAPISLTVTAVQS